jgi:quinoprotein glucose dehydrogenase
LLQKIKSDSKSLKLSGRDEGKKIYMNYCVNCHKENREGDEGQYPSLVNLQDRMTPKEALNKIREGSGRMPAFSKVIEGQEEAIINFLFEKRNKQLLPKQEALLEIKTNISSHTERENNSEKDDTASRYLNLNAYSQFKDIHGHPAIRPPWGMLNAINLNTGDYAWRIPVGNDSALREKGAPITGLWSSPGPMVTAGGLVFIGGMKDKKFFAFDKANGKLLWEITLPAKGTSNPCSYMVNGKQYVALSVGGDEKNPAGYIIAFALP